MVLTNAQRQRRVPALGPAEYEALTTGRQRPERYVDAVSRGRPPRRRKRRAAEVGVG